MAPIHPRNIARGFLDVLFPPVCLLCGNLSRGAHPHACPDCLSSFVPIGTPAFPAACLRCGEPHPNDPTPHLCLRCLTSPPPYGWCRSLFSFQGEMRKALSLLKYGRRLSLLPPLREALLAGVEDIRLPRVDAVVTVPLSPWGAVRRTFNQAVLLAGPLANRLGVPLRTGALARRGRTPNARLSRGKRAGNARRSFAAGREMGKVEGRRVLLFDDVLTTGATVEACARLLGRAGAEVAVLTLARAPRRKAGKAFIAVEDEPGGENR